MVKIILISGYKRSGKDYITNEIKEAYGIESLTFATPLKQIMATTLGISVDKLEALKNDPSQKWENSGVSFSARELLQRFGTDAMKKEFGDDIWTRMLYYNLPSSGVVVVSDWRFKVEYEYLSTRCKVLTVRVTDRNIINTDQHPSEIELDDFDFDVHIDNTVKNKPHTKKLREIMQKVNGL